jgi:integrase
MAAKVLTARFIETVKPRRNAAGAAVRSEFPDAGCPGLYAVIQPTGTRSWAFRYRRPDGGSAKQTFAGELTLAAARHAASAARLRLEQGADPAPKRLPAAAYHPVTGEAIEAVVATFLEQHARRKNRPSTAWAAERIFNRIVLPAWRGRGVTEIRRRDVIDLVEHVATDRPYLANRTLGVLSKFYNWCCARDLVAVSPVSGVERPHEEKARDRTLTDAELRRLWHAAEGPFGAALQVLALTGSRRNEVSRMTWDEIDGDQWTLPAARAKNDVEHTVTLPRQARAIIAAQPRFAGCPFVFTADGKSPIIGWAKAKTRISAKAGIAEESWRLHDLRRTCASGMQKLGIRTEAIERALNHRSGVYRGIVGTYQTDKLDDEVAEALQAWANRVDEIVAVAPAKVVKLHRR